MRRAKAAMMVAILLGWTAWGPIESASSAVPSLVERVDSLASDFTSQFATLGTRYHLSLEQVLQLSDRLNDDHWAAYARKMGVPARDVERLYQALMALPHKRNDELTPYNLLNPAKDRWGLTAKEAQLGWQKYGPIIEQVAIEQDIDPLILGAYVWTESNFDTRQDTRARGKVAVGLASIQAQDYAHLGGALEDRVERLKRDPYLNLTLAAKEFKAHWNPNDMFGTVMDVWYPAWRRQGAIPNMGTAYAYVQLFSNRYFLLMTVMGG
ncbi:MAG TPA: hypothetical protein V6D05_03090 [Stenomitos sp.]